MYRSGSSAGEQYSQWLFQKFSCELIEWLDKVILEIIKPHYFVLSSSRGIVSLKKNFFNGRSSLGRYVFGSEISYNKPPPRLPGLAY